MRERFWLANLYQQLTVLRHRSRGRRRTRGPASAEPSIVEALESRKLLSGGSVAPAGSETLVNTFTTLNQKEPSTAMDANGDYVVTWAAYAEDQSHYGVFAQRYNSAGARQGNEFQVNTFTTGDQRAPSVAMDASGAFVIVWSSTAQDGDSIGVYAQRYNASGGVQGGEFRVNTVTTGSQTAAKVAMDTAGDFVVTWQSDGQDGSGLGAFARRYNSSGVAQANEFQVNTSTLNDEGKPDIAMDATGDFVITWLQFNTDQFDYIVDARRYNSSGVALGNPVAVTSGLSFGETPTVAMDQTGDFVVTWGAYIYESVDPHSYGIYAQRYNSQAVPRGGIFLANTTLAGAQVDPAVTMDPTGNFVITWTSNLQDGSQFGVYGQGYNAAGVRQGGEFKVNTFTTNAQEDPSVAIDSKGDFVVAWASYFQDGDGDGIYSQRFKLNAIKSNQAPLGTAKTATTLEDKSYIFTTADFGFTDPNDSPANKLLSVKITTLPSIGSLKDGDTAVTAGSSILATDIAAGKLIFTPVANKNGPAYASFKFQVRDDGGVANGGIDTDPTARTMTVAVTSVNDAPVGTAKTVTTLEDKPYVLTSADFGFADPNDVPANTLLSVKIATLPAVGSLTTNGTAVTAGSSVLATDIAAGKLKFTPVANKNGAAYASFTFQVRDNGGVANGGVDTDPTVRKMTVAVTSVNDAPVGTVKTVTALEEKTYVFTSADFGFTDPNDVPANTLLSVKITTLPSVGSLTNNGTAVIAGSSVLAADIAAGKLKFTPVANKNGAAYASFTFQVRDNGGVANGGVDTDPTSRKMTVTVTSVNDAPVGTAGTLTGLVNTAYHFKIADFGFTDPNDNPADTLKAVKITLLPNAGTLTDNGVAVTVNQIVTATEISSGKLVFTPHLNLAGGPYFLCKFQVQDTGGTANGGVDLDPTLKVLVINLVKLNHPPAGTSGTVTTPKNVAYQFKIADFGFTDPNDSPSNTLKAVKITLLPNAGTLTDNGVAVAVNQFVSAADISGGKLVFTPKANLTGGPFFLCKFQVQDNGGTLVGGGDLDLVAKVLEVKITV